jgi:hypothetical protein
LESQLRAERSENSRLKARVAEIEELKAEIEVLKAENSLPREQQRPRFLERFRSKPAPAAAPLDQLLPGSLASGFSPVLGEWLGATAPLRQLWKSSNPSDVQGFHGACGKRGYPGNTLVVVRSKEGNIFGGFSVPAWESRSEGVWKDDATKLTFLFVLRNTFGDSPTRFPKKSPTKAIYCSSYWGPNFAGDSRFEIVVWNASCSFENLQGGYVDKLGRGTAAFVSSGAGEQKFEVDSYEVWAAAGLPTPCA